MADKFVVDNRAFVSCLPNTRSRDNDPVAISEVTARSMLERARRDLAAELDMGYDAYGRQRWNSMLEDGFRAHIAALEEALADYECQDLTRARQAVSALHPDHGGPGGEQFKSAVRRLRRAKTPENTHAA